MSEAAPKRVEIVLRTNADRPLPDRFELPIRARPVSRPIVTWRVEPHPSGQWVAFDIATELTSRTGAFYAGWWVWDRAGQVVAYVGDCADVRFALRHDRGFSLESGTLTEWSWPPPKRRKGEATPTVEKIAAWPIALDGRSPIGLRLAVAPDGQRFAVSSVGMVKGAHPMRCATFGYSVLARTSDELATTTRLEVPCGPEWASRPAGPVFSRDGRFLLTSFGPMGAPDEGPDGRLLVHDFEADRIGWVPLSAEQPPLEEEPAFPIGTWEPEPELDGTAMIPLRRGRSVVVAAAHVGEAVCPRA